MTNINFTAALRAEYINRMCKLSRQYAVIAARIAHYAGPRRKLALDELATRANHVIAAMERNA